MDGSPPSPERFTHQLTLPSDEVSKKLRGGVWERSDVARGIYAGTLSLGRWLAEHGVTPNFLTYTALSLALGAGIAAGVGTYWLSALLLLASGAFDLLDGIVARAGNQSTRFGALLDSTVDRIADALPLMGLLISCSPTQLVSFVLAVAMLSGFAVSYVRARAEGLGVQLPPLFMRRAERVVMTLVALLVGSAPIPGFPNEVAMLSIISVMALLSGVAAVWALRAAYVALESEARRVSSAEVAPTPSRP